MIFLGNRVGWGGWGGQEVRCNMPDALDATLQHVALDATLQHVSCHLPDALDATLQHVALDATLQHVYTLVTKHSSFFCA